MKKRKNNKKSSVKKRNVNIEKQIKKELLNQDTKHHLFGIKIIVIGLLLYAVYSLVMIILYSSALVVQGNFKESVISGLVEDSYLKEFIVLYGKEKAENFFLLIGLFGSLITFVLDIWFSFGLWKRKDLARLTVAVFSIVLFTVSLFDLLYAGYDGYMQTIWIVLYAFIAIYLLLNNNVKKVFK